MLVQLIGCQNFLCLSIYFFENWPRLMAKVELWGCIAHAHEGRNLVDCCAKGRIA
jgi:hypothetical protein